MDGVFWILFGVIAVPFTLLGLLLSALAAYLFLQRWWLMLFGERTLGTVVGLAEAKDANPADGDLSELAETSPFLRLVFTDSDGKECKVSSDTSVSPRKFRPGDEVPVLYLPDHPKTFVVDRFWLKWSAPFWLFLIGLVLTVPGLVVLGAVWPAFGTWAASLGQQVFPWIVPQVFIVMAFLFMLLGGAMLRDRWHRKRHDFWTTGTVTATGWRRSGKDSYRWIRVDYQDAEGHEHARTVTVSSARQVGQCVPLLVDPQRPGSVLLNEPFELWFLPGMCLGIGTIVFVVFIWAWMTGEFH